MIDDFFNELLSGFANPKRAFKHYEKNKFNEHTRREVRQKLLGAEKFYVDDSLLENAVNAGFSSPKALLGMLRQAKPPFTNMWIEWNNIKKVELVKKARRDLGWPVGSDSLTEDEKQSRMFADKVGYHIQSTKDQFVVSQAYREHARGTNDMGMYQLNHYSLFKKTGEEGRERDRVVIPPHSIMLCNDNYFPVTKYLLNDEGFNNGRKPSKKEEADFIEAQVFFGGAVIGEVYQKTHGSNKIFEDICRHTYLAAHDSGSLNYGVDAMLQILKGGTGHQQIMAQSVGIMDGDLRFIIALLSLLNYQHNVYERELVTQLPKRYRFGGAVPRNEVRVLEIDLPKPFGTKKYERMFKGFGSPKRQHKRRGHWHTYHYKNGEKRHKWIEEQLVGNPELGKIEHDYVLKRRNG